MSERLIDPAGAPGREIPVESVLVRVPDAKLGTRYPITMRLSGAGVASTARVEILVADLHYLPAVTR